MDDLVSKSLDAKRESKYVDFKGSFDPDSGQDWCEIVKDIVAMANSDGGMLLIGLNNKGEPTGADVSGLLAQDPAVITDRIYKYTGRQFSQFQMDQAIKQSPMIAVIQVFSVRNLIVFSKPGTYDIGGGKQRTAFSQGTVYFRHGAKSEPGTSDDLRNFIETRIEEVRQELLKGVQKVMEAPPGSQVAILSSEVFESESPQAFPIRIVDDDSAPAYRKIDPNISHPHRLTELVAEVNKKLPGTARINRYDILSVRKVFDIDNTLKFCYQPKYSSNQYSSAFADWLTEEYIKDDAFFEEARKSYLRIRRK